ncbi:MAG: flippase [Elusimicrobiota bacterium]
MTKIKLRIFQNFSWIALGNATAMFFGFLGNIYLARVLLPENFGKIIYALTVVQYLILFSDFGFSTWGIREIAKNKDKINLYFNDILSFRFIVSLLMTALFAGYVWFFTNSAWDLKILLIGTVLSLIPLSLNTEWIWQGLEKMSIAGIARSLPFVLSLLFFVFFIKKPQSYLIVPLIRFMAITFASVSVLFLLKVKFALFSFSRIKIYLRKSFYFWLILLLLQVYHGSDIIFMQIYRSSAELGLYAASYKLVTVLIQVQAWLNLAIFPTISNLFSSNRKEFHTVRKIFIAFSLFMGIAMLVLALLWGDKFILLTLGSQYQSAVPVFQWLIVGAAIYSISGPFAQSLLAMGFEKSVLRQVSGCAVINLILNFILIPRFGAYGAVWSYISAELLAAIWIITVFYSKHNENYLYSSLPVA